MERQEVGRLAALIQEKICAVCIDRNVDGTCDKEAEGTCTLMQKLGPAAEAVLKVSSDRIEPYIQSIRDNVCATCELRFPDGSCAVRDTDHCMLNSYLPLVVEAIEEHFGRAFPSAEGLTAPPVH
ncbi:MAG: hypothetical protein HY236_06115 [Acidobacteria bacterium]|nr:hypothetical protein [Acidobacteriota bacterium]